MLKVFIILFFCVFSSAVFAEQTNISVIDADAISEAQATSRNGLKYSLALNPVGFGPIPDFGYGYSAGY